MRDPRPLVEGEATDFERQLLSAARQEQPSPEMVGRMERALGIVGVTSVVGIVAASVPTGAAAAEASVRAGAKVGIKTGVLAAKSVGLLALVAGGVIGARLLLVHPAVVAHHPGAYVTSSAPVTNGEAAATAPEGAGPGPGLAPSTTKSANDTAVVAPALVAPAAVAPASGVGSRAAGTSTLRGEIVLIDGARNALAAGSPAQAMRLLHQYSVRYPKGALGPEALVVRIEALDKSGQHASARALARTFVADHPSSPLVDRLARLHLAPEGHR